jgi:hypothetical protein
VVRRAVTDIGHVRIILHINYQRITLFSVDGLSLQKGNILEGGRFGPDDIELLLLIDFGGYLSLLSLTNVVGHIWTQHILG